jgi:hypothetical protein
MRINPKLIELWTRAAKQYHESLAGSPAEAYLKERGILDGASRFMLGYVAEVAPGHEDRIKNHLSIPFLEVVGFHFPNSSRLPNHTTGAFRSKWQSYQYPKP